MLEKYNLLRQDFLSIAEPFIDSDILDQLKRNYAYEIESIRKLSQVKDLKTFIRLLEKRDIMSCSNIEPLWYISKKYIHKPDLETKLQDYERWLETVPPSSLCNKYRSDETLVSSSASASASTSSECSACNSMHNLSQSSIENSTELFSNSIQTLHCNPEQEEQYKLYKRRKLLQETVVLQIKDRLGRSWRDVARHLGIRECEIDAVQSKYPYDLKEQSYEILKIYLSQSDTEQWAINLIRALEKGRRRDLKELVEELILKNGNL
ncbi:PREDICTED: fas-associated death domain protein [Wasmannia auropunctata]|uniref:fas-associated death domain protein n=1 Tax=Wasmannia auropunctata TaxID=64793 RepID=UPI0005EFC7BD|nr:PREDICTED: fas-associated death domain protein [Wasmannia auropunctata]XP_011698651.1 PREDICTED: fas-associated death domain protein [Wasmannia auropunctata]